MSSPYRFNRLGLSHWDPYAVRRGSCLELYYCNMVEWFWWDSSLIFNDQLVSFGLRYFDTVGLVIWPVKIVPEMTYYVSSGTINLYNALQSNYTFRQQRFFSLSSFDTSALVLKVSFSRSFFHP